MKDVDKHMEYCTGLFLRKQSKCELECGIDTDLHEAHSNNIGLANADFVMVFIIRRNKPHLFGYFSILDLFLLKITSREARYSSAVE